MRKDSGYSYLNGKRYRAHCGHDPGEYDPYGPIRKTRGGGTYFQVVDIDRDGRLDIVAPGKAGLYLSKNLGYAENTGD